MKKKAILITVMTFFLAACAGGAPEAAVTVQATVTNTPLTGLAATFAYHQTQNATRVEGEKTAAVGTLTAIALTPSLTPSATLPPTQTPTFTPTFSPFIEMTPTPVSFVRHDNPVPQPEEVIGPENIDRLVELARWGRGAILDVQLSPGGAYFYVLTTQEVIAYETRSQEELWKYVDSVGLTSMDVQPTGGLLAAGTWDGRLVFIDRLEGSVVLGRQGQIGAVTAVRFYPDGKRLASGGDDLKVRVWRMEEMVVDWETEVEPGPVQAIYLSSGVTSMIVDQEDSFQVLDPENGEILASIRPRANPEEMYFSPDGNFLSDGYHMWEARTGDHLYNIRHKYGDWGFSAGVFSPDGGLFAVSFVGEDIVDVLRVSDGELVHRLVSPFSEEQSGIGGLLAAPSLRSGPGEGGAFSLAFSPDGKTLAANMGRGTEFWDMGTGKFIDWVDESGGEMIYTHGGERLIAWWEDSVSQIEISEKAAIHSTAGFTAGYGREFHFSPDGRWVLSNSVVWDIPNGRKAFVLGDEWVLAVSSSGDLVYTESYQQGEIILRRMSDFGVVKTIQLSEPGVDYFYFDSLSPAGDYVTSHVSGVNIDGLYTWDISTLKLVPDLTIEATWDRYYRTEYSSDGHYRVTYSSVELFVHQVTPEIKHVGSILDDYLYIDSASLSTDGDLLAVSTDEEVIVYQIGEIGLIERFRWGKGTRSHSYSLEFSSDNRLLAFLDHEDKIAVLDVNTGEWIAQIDAPIAEIYGFEFSPDGRYLVIASGDGTVRLWGIAP